MSKENPTWSDLSEKQQLIGFILAGFIVYQGYCFNRDAKQLAVDIKKEQCMYKVESFFLKKDIPFTEEKQKEYSVRCTQETI